MASPAMSSLVARGTELLESSPTRHQLDTVECVAPIQDRHDASDIEQALREHARDVRRTGRCIGLMPFIVYGYRRRVRVHVLLGESTVDLLQSFAPELSENLVGRALPLTAIIVIIIIIVIVIVIVNIIINRIVIIIDHRSSSSSSSS